MWTEHELKDDEIIVNKSHPMKYAYSMMVLEKKYGAFTIMVKQNSSFVFEGGRKTPEQVWEDVCRILEHHGLKVNMIGEDSTEVFRKMRVTIEVK